MIFKASHDLKTFPSVLIFRSARRYIFIHSIFVIVFISLRVVILSLSSII